VSVAGLSPRWRRRLGDIFLLPLAVLLVLVEDVLWRLARRALREITVWPPMQALRDRLSRLSGWAALPLFLVPEMAGRVGELWVGVLLYRGHLVSAVLVYAAVRLLATLIAVFIWQACSAALLRLPWFARVVGWVLAARDWSLARVAPIRDRLRRLLARERGGVLHRARLLRLTVLGRVKARR
jgi:hypothetical protein